jgi:superoxide oxidase
VLQLNWKNTRDHYGALSIAMHWLMFLLLIAVYACIELREIFPKGSDPREALKLWHSMLGLSVFLLVFIRLSLRFTGPIPVILPEVAAWQQKIAGVMHFALYLFMIAQPLLGWLLLSAEGKPVVLFGLPLPAIWSRNEGYAELFEETHELIGTAGYYLVGLHSAAALFHHYFMRDNTLVRMLPQKQRIG